jgi:hypothetical protein
MEHSSMNAYYIAAALVSVFGTALALIVAARCLTIPGSLSPDENPWLCDEVDYLWWVEGIR